MRMYQSVITGCGVLILASFLYGFGAPSVGGSLESRTVSLLPQDTYLSLQATNHAQATKLTTYTWPDYQVSEAVLMKFDLSSLPAGALVTNATLYLALIDSDKTTATTYRVAAHKVIGRNPVIQKATGYTADGATAWRSNDCCYQGAPLAQADVAPASDTQPIDKTPGFKSWTVTDMVRDWLAAPASNFGLLLNADTTTTAEHYRSFASAEYEDARLRPRLAISFVAPDATPPSVAITAPASGRRISGTALLTARATDNVAVAGVQFRMSGTPLGPELTAVPYSFHWDTTSVSDGSYSLYAVARDLAGNRATSGAVTVIVKNGILVLRPQDTFLNVDAKNYSRANTLRTYTWPDHQGANAILMKFDLSTLPQGTVVQQAKVFLALVESDKTADKTYTVTAHKVLGKNPVIAAATGYTADGMTPWTPIACCYNGVPLAQADISPAYDTRTIDKTPGFKSWTITPMVQEWVTDASTNFGVVLSSDASKPRDRYRYFASAEHSDARLRPWLQVQYAPAGDTMPPEGGIAARYPGDVGIENDPDVVLVEKFQEAALSDVFKRWTDVLNGRVMSFSTDVPAGSRQSRSLNIPSVGGGVNNGGHLYKVLSPGMTDTLYVRYYIKYPTTGTPHHSGVWLGGYNPPSAWPDPQAGVKPTGHDRFIAAAEQNIVIGSFDHYNYWMGMHPGADGSYWGNFLLNNPKVQTRRGEWTCVEHMVKLNNPATAHNGEHAIWLDGVKVSHLGQGFPHGSWSGGIFTQLPSGAPFGGFQWRSDSRLNINWIWLQNYSPDDPAGFSSTLKFAHVVAAKSYIGCLAYAPEGLGAPTGIRSVKK